VSLVISLQIRDVPNSAGLSSACGFLLVFLFKIYLWSVLLFSLILFFGIGVFAAYVTILKIFIRFFVSQTNCCVSSQKLLAKRVCYLLCT